MTCPHDVTEREVAAVADGLCPICLAAENKRLRAALEQIRDDIGPGFGEPECALIARAALAYEQLITEGRPNG